MPACLSLLPEVQHPESKDARVTTDMVCHPRMADWVGGLVGVGAYRGPSRALEPCTLTLIRYAPLVRGAGERRQRDECWWPK